MKIRYEMREREGEGTEEGRGRKGRIKRGGGSKEGRNERERGRKEVTKESNIVTISLHRLLLLTSNCHFLIRVELSFNKS